MDECGLIDDLTTLRTLAPAGFALALHIGYGTSRYLLKTFPDAWFARYCAANMVVRDPAVKWGIAHVGTIRWQDLPGAGDSDVLAQARAWGLRHGLSVAIQDCGSRSIGSFARSDRDFSDSEVSAIEELVRKVHLATGDMDALDEDVLDFLV